MSALGIITEAEYCALTLLPVESGALSVRGWEDEIRRMTPLFAANKSQIVAYLLEHRAHTASEAVAAAERIIRD
jgi:hypothetical protein